MEQGVFISYSHTDTDAVRDLVGLISNQVQFPVWYDNNLHGGDHYFSIIAERILKYEYFLFVVSPHSVCSEFCTMELEFAKSEKRKILTVWLEDFIPPPRIRMVISHTHYIRTFALSREALVEELRQALVGDHLSADVMPSQQAVSDRILEGYKYFLRDEQKKKIQYLLQLESQGKYGACYEPDAAVLLGLAYELGIHTAKDLRTAEYYYRIAIHKGSADGEFLHLSMQMEAGKVPLAEATERMRQLAEGGSLMAMVYWGDDVYNGRYHQRPNKEQAYRWWRIAADRHHPEAQYYMAFGYRSGECGATDPLLAMMYAKESEEGGFPRAHRLQGFLYRRGEFVEKDMEKAIACYQKAVNMGDYLSLNYIGDVEWFRGNKDKAVSFYRQAVEHAEAGRIKSGAPYYNLGFSYRKGEGAEKDPLMACKMYLKGAARNHANSQKWAALTIYQDLKDPEEKFALLEEASQYNCRRAEFYLGKLLEAKLEDRSTGSAEALKWYELGVDKGDVDCMRYAMEYYSAVAQPAAFRDRQKALAVMRLFFSMWDADQQEVEEKSGFTFSIAYYYQLYAFELATIPESGKSDRELALFYARKCMAEKDGSSYWGNFVALAWQYLIPEARSPLVAPDPVAGRNVTLLLLERMEEYVNADLDAQKKRFRMQGLAQCLEQLEKLYQNSRSELAKDLSGKEAAAEARRFHDLALSVRERMKQI